MEEIGTQRVKAVLGYLKSRLPSREECILQLEAHEYLDALSYATDHLPQAATYAIDQKPEEGKKVEQSKKRKRREA